MTTEPVPFSPEWYSDPAAWAPSRFERGVARVFNAVIDTLAFLVGARRAK